MSDETENDLSHLPPEEVLSLFALDLRNISGSIETIAMLLEENEGDADEIKELSEMLVKQSINLNRAISIAQEYLKNRRANDS